MILESAVLCLALNIYHEARSEMIPGQYAVAHVTMNRAGSQSNICKTVTAKHQFSWTTTLLKRTGPNRFALKPQGMPKDERAWHLAKHIARYALANPKFDVTLGATHYHTTKVRPTWRKSMQFVKRMGNHVFYRMA